MVCAWGEVSKMIGRRPTKVVAKLSRTGRKRWRTASTAPISAVSSLSISKKATKRIALLTTMPASEAKPTKLGMARSMPTARWPSTTPMIAKGIDSITTRGRV